MNINRYNYEEFFLLYVDNELDAASRKAVELFVQENPDLEEELVMIQQSTLKADHSLVLDKTTLFRKEESGVVNYTNYEEFFVLYVDEELIPSQRKAVEDFVSKNPSLRSELELLLQTRIAADLSVTFPDKSLLFREERSEKPVVFLTFSLRVAIAAILLLAVGIFWLVSQEGAKVDPQVATVKEVKKETGAKSESGDRSQDTREKTEVSKDQKQDLAVTKQDAEEKDPSLLTGKKIQNQKSGIQNPKSEQPLIAKIETPEEAKNIDHSIVSDPSQSLAKNESTSFSPEKIEIIDHPATVVEPSSNIIPTGIQGVEKDEVVIGPGIGTKNKLRGFFRKVTRVIGRTTNLPATENKSLLIGNLEIALK